MAKPHQATDQSWTLGPNLAPLRPADLPAPPPDRWKLIGPGIVAAGVGLGSSEFILFPFIAAQVGLSLLWGAILVIFMQYFMIMEAERYALATGETVMTGFCRFGRWWGVVLCAGNLLIALWPGWASSSGVLMTYLFGGIANWWAVGMMLVIGVILTLSKTAYRSLERAEILKVAATAIFFLVSIALVIPLATLARAPALIADVAFPVAELGWPLVLAALAFAGTGAGGILCQSNWIRDKGFGMGTHAPRIVSPLLGHPVAAPGTGWWFELTTQNMERWRAWWRFANIEQLSTFVAICILTIAFTSLLAFALLHGREDLPSDIRFLAVQGAELQRLVGRWFEILFYAVGAVALFATALGVVDISGRIIADTIRTTYHPQASESLIYACTVWALLAIGITILLSGSSQPVGLLILSGCASGVMMFVIAGLMLKLNHRLPRPLRPSLFRTIMLWLTILFFFALFVATVADQLGLL